MKKLLPLLISTLVLAGCETYQGAYLTQPSVPLNKKDSWVCKDHGEVGTILFEVDYLNNTSLDLGMARSGAVYFDGRISGAGAAYSKAGLNHRWDWKGNSGENSFIIKPDGTGLLYDFTDIPEGVSTGPKAHFECFER